MCGIVGALAFGELPKAEEKIRQESMLYLTTELLQLTKKRGEDATGIANLFRDGVYTCLKMGVDAEEFITRYGGKETDYEGYIKMWRANLSPTNMIIAHCRKSSVGNSWSNVNNHPIRVEDVLGIHNGTLQNHDEIFEKLGCGRDGTVDSEAIVRLVHHFSKNGTIPITTDMILEVAKRLQGTYAVMVMSGNNPYQMALFRDSRPIEFALIKPLKMVIIASELPFIKRAFLNYNQMGHLYNKKSGFTHLSAKNVEFKMMLDDSTTIFDLTRDVTDDTSIEDLYDSEKIPRTTKIWEVTKAFGNNYGQGWQGRHNTSSTSSKSTTSTTVAAKSTSTDKKDTKKAVIWNKDLKKFNASEAEIEKASKNGATEVDTKTGGVVEVTEGTDIVLKEASNVEAVVTEQAKIKQLPAPKSTVSAEAEKKKVEVKEVLMDVDTGALEEAEKASKAIEKYENETDVQVDLEVDDVKALKALPLHALCNRVRKAAYKRAYYDAIVLFKKEFTADNKGNKIQKNIRVMKGIMSILVHMVCTLKTVSTANESPYSRHKRATELAVNVALSSNSELNSKEFDNVISSGDTNKHRTLLDVRNILSMKENK